MHSSTAIAMLLAAGVSAQTATQTLLIPGFTSADVPSVTAVASNAQATTYTLSCKTNLSNLTDSFNSATSAIGSAIGSAASSLGAAFSSVQSNLATRTTGNLQLPPITGIPTSLPTGLVKRQDNNDLEINMCLPFQIVQGAKTWGAHLTISEASITVDVNCQFGGADIFKGPATCTEVAAGEVLGIGAKTTDTTTMQVSEYTSWAHAVAVTQGTGSANKPTGTASNSAGGAQHTGAAAGLHVPAAVGAGAMAVLGAALAL